MTLEWNTIFQGVQAIGQLAGVAVAFYAVRLVHNYTTRRDKTEFLRNVWHEQQQLNLATLGNEDALEQFEKIVYGDAHVPDRNETKRRFHIFLYLNRIQHYSFAYKNNLLTKQEYVALAERTLRLIKREQPLIEYLLRERGYDPEFAREVLEQLKAVTPVASRK